jgi:hypothetical protein
LSITIDAVDCNPMRVTHTTEQAARCELRFRSLFDPGRAFVFPCDAQGRVSLDAMSTAARESYLRVQALVGTELAAPIVAPVGG